MRARACLAQDFASGYEFGRLFAALGLQPDFGAFEAKGTPAAQLANHTRLQPTFERLGIKYDARTARALLDRQPGLAARLLASVRGAFAALDSNAQVRARPARGPTAVLAQSSTKLCAVHRV